MISKYTLTKRLNNYQLIRFYCKDIKNKYTNTVLVPKTKFSQKLTGKKLIGQNKYVLEVMVHINVIFNFYSYFYITWNVDKLNQN